MKLKLTSILLAAILIGCTMNQQKISYNTLYSVEKVTQGAYKSYLGLAVSGKVATNDVPKVSQAYNKFQVSMVVALDSVQFNTNALAPVSLQTESIDLINMINTLKGTK